MPKPHCIDCTHWGDGDGTGFSYDAGAMNYCKHPSINGIQHPSYGACGDTKTMLYTGGLPSQSIMTRRNFGCVLFVQREEKKL